MDNRTTTPATLHKMWVCVGSHGWADHQTIQYKRTDAIKELLKGSSWNWAKYKRRGWRCIKVNIIFQPI